VYLNAYIYFHLYQRRDAAPISLSIERKMNCIIARVLNAFLRCVRLSAMVHCSTKFQSLSLPSPSSLSSGLNVSYVDCY